MHILYIEDEPNDARLVERYAHSVGHRLTHVNNIADARQAIAAQPDLVLVDVMLGHARQGFAFVSELRQQGYHQPILAVTGLSLPNDLEECYRVGCTGIINKPYMINELADAIEKYRK
jgi:CheY-like chemotaxis protein